MMLMASIPDFETFRASVASSAPPPGLPPLLLALWWDGKGEWESGHEIAQVQSGPDAAWVHAYLHRKEGDSGNAGYWYRQAGKPFPRCTMEEEWERIAKALLPAVGPTGPNDQNDPAP